MADSVSLDLTDIDKDLEPVSLSLDLNEIDEESVFRLGSETSDLVPGIAGDTTAKILAYLEEEHREQSDLIRRLENFEQRLDECSGEVHL